jgi:hypothetical protein
MACGALTDPRQRASPSRVSEDGLVVTDASTSETVIALAIAVAAIVFPFAVVLLAYVAYRGGFARHRD